MGDNEEGLRQRAPQGHSSQPSRSKRGEAEDDAEQVVVGRNPILTGIGLVVFTAISYWLATIYGKEPVVDPLDYSLRTDNILKSTPLIDGHNDLPYLLRLELRNKIYDKSVFTFRESREGRLLGLNPPMFSLMMLVRSCKPHGPSSHERGPGRRSVLVYLRGVPRGGRGPG